jgi:hypothetical protein
MTLLLECGSCGTVEHFCLSFLIACFFLFAALCLCVTSRLCVCVYVQGRFAVAKFAFYYNKSDMLHFNNS